MRVFESKIRMRCPVWSLFPTRTPDPFHVRMVWTKSHIRARAEWANHSWTLISSKIWLGPGSMTSWHDRLHQVSFLKLQLKAVSFGASWLCSYHSFNSCAVLLNDLDINWNAIPKKLAYMCRMCVLAVQIEQWCYSYFFTLSANWQEGAWLCVLCPEIADQQENPHSLHGQPRALHAQKEAGHHRGR